jgi:hypothetical protein
MKRRNVLKAGAAIVIAPFVARNAEACPDHESAAPPPKWDNLVARIGRNHGHAFPISLDDVVTGAEKTYDLAGKSGHPHAIKVTADDFKRLRAGEVVRLASSKEGGHIHRLLLRCAPAVEPPERVNVCEVVVSGKDEHEFIITAADVASKGDKTYDIQGLSGHTHSVTFTAADFKELSAGKQVSIQSSTTDGHTHFALVRYPLKA